MFRRYGAVKFFTYRAGAICALAFAFFNVTIASANPWVTTTKYSGTSSTAQNCSPEAFMDCMNKKHAIVSGQVNKMQKETVCRNKAAQKPCYFLDVQNPEAISIINEKDIPQIVTLLKTHAAFQRAESRWESANGCELRAETARLLLEKQGYGVPAKKLNVGKAFVVGQLEFNGHTYPYHASIAVRVRNAVTGQVEMRVIEPLIPTANAGLTVDTWVNHFTANSDPLPEVKITEGCQYQPKLSAGEKALQGAMRCSDLDNGTVSNLGSETRCLATFNRTTCK
ncbi:MAG: hypothetical protein V4736_05955 [Bdellovibrionota bacterium]